MIDAVVVILWLPVIQLCNYVFSAYNFGKSSNSYLTVSYNISLYRDKKVAIYRYNQIMHRYTSNMSTTMQCMQTMISLQAQPWINSYLERDGVHTR